MTPGRRVIVIGAGNAALCAAMAARGTDAQVTVLEAAGREERGGNSAFAGASFRFAFDDLDHLLPILTAESKDRDLPRSRVMPYPAERYFNDLIDISQGAADRHLTEVLVANSYDTMMWLRSLGVEWELTTRKYVDVTSLSADTEVVLAPGSAVRAVGKGTGLMRHLFDAVERSGISVWYDSPAEDLVLEGNDVVGVVVNRGGQRITVPGQVVLCCGGFEASADLRARYLGQEWAAARVRGSRFNTGTMLERALAAGAATDGHWDGCHASPQDIDLPPFGDLSTTDAFARYSYGYGILVNTRGERFIDEGEARYALTYAKTGGAILRQPEGRAFELFDQQVVHLLDPRYASAEPRVADTIEQLARNLGIPVAGLVATVSAYNRAPRSGAFRPFAEDGLQAKGIEPPKSNWALPLDAPPFVSYEVTGGITFTYGGLRTDLEGRVIGTSGRPIPGLYAAGEITGGLFHHNCAAGSGLMSGSVFGRLAGATAAVEG